VLVGLLVFGLWVGLDSYYPPIDVAFKKVLCPFLKSFGLEGWCTAQVKKSTPWNPFTQFTTGWAWFFVWVRILGSAMVVPPLE